MAAFSSSVTLFHKHWGLNGTFKDMRLDFQSCISMLAEAADRFEDKVNESGQIEEALGRGSSVL